MRGPMSLPVVDRTPTRRDIPRAPFLRFSTLWIQITGTWCNLACAHCINASGPNDPWLKPLPPEVARRAICEADDLGVKEIYFTGGEPFLHGDLLALLAEALVVAPTTVLTNGTLIDDAVADRLPSPAQRGAHSLQVPGRPDDTGRRRHDRIRGAGGLDPAVR